MARNAQHKVIGWIQLIGGIAVLWSAFQGSYTTGVAVIGLIFLATGYNHVTSTR
jgi:hypothetical protein